MDYTKFTNMNDEQMLDFTLSCLHHPDPLTRKEALQLLCDTKHFFGVVASPEIAEKIKPFLEDSEACVRYAAVMALAFLGDHKALIDYWEKDVEEDCFVLQALKFVTEPFCEELQEDNWEDSNTDMCSV